MDNKVQMIGLGLVFALCLFCAVKVMVRWVKSRYGKVTRVRAKVIEKFKTETFTKYKGNGKHEQCRIIFEVEGKRRSFPVSEFSYENGYKVGKEGTLTYQGDRLIDFE